MKTKILSKLVLMGFTAVMIAGCGAEKNLTTCNKCEEADHTILLPDAERMIAAFHNNFIVTNRVANAGGVIDLSNWKSGFILWGFKPLKMHYGFDTSNNNLELSVEPTNEKCKNGIYIGNEGVESAQLITSKSSILPISTTRITSNDVHTFLGNAFNTPSNVQTISQEIARTLNNNFLNSFRTDYDCKDLHFYPKASIDQISSETGNKNFAYFFGYDESPGTCYKIRVILVGIKSGRLVLEDEQNNSLMRDYSRPYPLLPCK